MAKPRSTYRCEACGHTDIREKFERNFNVCPSCDYHRRIRAHDYCALLLDDNSSATPAADRVVKVSKPCFRRSGRTRARSALLTTLLSILSSTAHDRALPRLWRQWLRGIGPEVNEVEDEYLSPDLD